VNLDEGLLRGADVLVVDDEPADVALIEQMLNRNGFSRITTTTDPRDFRAIFLDTHPDIVLLDLHMPHLDALDLLAQVQEMRGPEEYLPVLVLSDDATPRARIDALGAGAVDFLAKPLDTTEVGLRVLNCLEARRLHLRLQGERRELDDLVRLRTSELEHAHVQTLERLHLVSAIRDDKANEHTNRVGLSAARLVRAAGGSAELAALIMRAAPLHDLGQVGVPDAVLMKPGKLTTEEFEIVRAHPVIGAQIIGDSTSQVLSVARAIAETHHERWNGEGYPTGLTGTEIPLAGRVVAVCDVFDALTHERPYKEAWPVADAVEELVAQQGEFFDPALVDLFVDEVLPGLPWLAPQPPRARATGATELPRIPRVTHPQRRATPRRPVYRAADIAVGNNARVAIGIQPTGGDVAFPDRGRKRQG